MIDWIRRNKKIVAAIGAGISATATALGYEFSPQLKAIWTIIGG